MHGLQDESAPSTPVVAPISLSASSPPHPESHDTQPCATFPLSTPSASQTQAVSVTPIVPKIEPAAAHAPMSENMMIDLTLDPISPSAPSPQRSQSNTTRHLTTSTPTGSQTCPVIQKTESPAHTPAHEAITIDLTLDSEDDEPIVVKTGKRTSDVLENPTLRPFFTVKKEKKDVVDVRQAKKAKINIEGVIQRRGGILQDLVNEHK